MSDPAAEPPTTAPRVVVALPTTGSVHNATYESITRMIAATTATRATTFWWDNDQPHDRCRNTLIDRLVQQPDWSHLLFLDTDVAVPDDMLDRMLAHRVPIVCAPVPTLIRRYGPPDEPRGATVSTNIMVFDDPQLRGSIVEPESPGTGYRRVDPDDFPDGPFTTDATGLGACLIHRSVFESIERPWCAFVGQMGDGCIGEDIYFFRKARAAGFQVVVDPSIACDHFKHLDLTHLDLLYSDKLPISSWPRLQPPDHDRNILIAVRVPRTGWLPVRTMDCLYAWRARFDDRIQIERLFTDTVRGGFVALDHRTQSLDPRFTHILLLDADVVPHPEVLGLLASVDAPLVAGLTRRLIDGQIRWAFWQREPITGRLTAPQNIKLPEIKEPFDVDAVDPACLLLHRDTLRHVSSVLQLLDHGPDTDEAFIHRWCQAVTDATGRRPVQTPLTVERRSEVGLAGFLALKLKLKDTLRTRSRLQQEGPLSSLNKGEDGRVLCPP